MSLLCSGSRSRSGAARSSLATALLCLVLLACGSEPVAGASDPRQDDDLEHEPRDAGGTKRPDAGRDGGRDAAPSGRDVGAGEEPRTTLPDDDTCAAIREDAPAVRGAIDVVWIIDNSLSMIDEAARIAENLPRFLRSVQDSGADTRLAMITATDPAFGTPLAGERARYRWVPALVDSKVLYSVALFQLGAYRDFLRATAPLHFVMVTDDNDRIAASGFLDEMKRALGRDFTVHAIASESVNGRPCANPACGGIPIPLVCGAAAPGVAYTDAAARTGGESLSICVDDWTDVFTRLESAVIGSAPLPCTYPLSAASGDAFDPSRVQVVYTDERGRDEPLPRATSAASCGSQRAFHYDDATRPTELVLCPAACTAVQRGGSMDIAFGCESVPVL